MKTRITLACLVFFGGSAVAQEMSIDCTNADTEVEKAVCASPALSSMDTEMTRLYAAVVEDPDLSDKDASELEKTQQDWLQSRKSCGDPGQDLDACIADTYADRINVLLLDYPQARNADSRTSIGPVTYGCEGLDSPLSAVFINTEAPMVSLSWKDHWIALPQAMSGSGARYEGATQDGGSATFWVKGKEAMFTLPGQKRELSCKEQS